LETCVSGTESRCDELGGGRKKTFNTKRLLPHEENDLLVTRRNLHGKKTHQRKGGEDPALRKKPILRSKQGGARGKRAFLVRVSKVGCTHVR